MKKTLVSALTTALVVGAASTTFAAANPFSDVPSDHWAYDAVSQLAKDGVVDGYGDGTFRGNKEITRYEMAQIVAKAMAKNDVSAADKAMIDKLAAEFSDELNNLGVRVSNLEKKTDNVKWTGKAFYEYKSKRLQGNSSSNKNEYRFRFNPSAQVNEHWTANARIEYRSDSSSSTNSDTQVTRAYAEGQYTNLDIKLGKLPHYSTSDDGMIFDDNLSGAEVTFGKNLKTTLVAGRYDPSGTASSAVAGAGSVTETTPVNMQGIELNYAKDKWNVGAGYRHFAGANLAGGFFANTVAGNATTAGYGTDSANVWNIGAGYRFNKNVAMEAAYGENTQGQWDKKLRKAYNVQVTYKGADPANKGSFGIFAAYRYLGQGAAIMPTYDEIGAGQKGWALGTSYVFMPNIMGNLKYFKGKDLVNSGNNTDASMLYGSVEFYF